MQQQLPAVLSKRPMASSAKNILCITTTDVLGTRIIWGGGVGFVFNKYIDKKATNLVAERISNRVTLNRENSEMLR